MTFLNELIELEFFLSNLPYVFRCVVRFRAFITIILNTNILLSSTAGYTISNVVIINSSI